MKSMTWCIALAALAMGFCPCGPAAGQVPRPDNYVGPFGGRSIGTFIAPRPDQFGSGIQTSAGGTFLFLARPDGAAAFATPWRTYGPAAVDRATLNQLVVAPPAQAATAPSAATTMQYNLPNMASGAEAAPAAPPEAMGPDGVSAAEGAGMAPSIAPPPLANILLLRGGALNVAPSRAAQYVHSPELSERMTRIARNRGMLTGAEIDVALSSQIARLQGRVRTAYDRVLLANIAGLEPEVRQVDNRLTVEGQ
jgi:hypothetical protein